MTVENGIMPAFRPLKERFWDKVEKTSSCWLWTAGTDTFGYGQISNSRNILRAHRLSYEWSKGSIPVDACVLHTCDVPRCVNPDHLYLGDKKQNARDRVNRGREGDRSGDKNGRARLDWNIVEEIRQLGRLGRNTSELSRHYGIGWTTVDHILKYQTWRKKIMWCNTGINHV